MLLRIIVSMWLPLVTVFVGVQRHAVAGPRGRAPVKVFILAGQSNMEGQGVVDLDHERYYNGGRGNLEHVMRDPAKAARYRHLKNEAGQGVVRDDVWMWFQTGKAGLKKGGLGIGYTAYPGKHHIRPELQIGHRLGVERHCRRRRPCRRADRRRSRLQRG